MRRLLAPLVLAAAGALAIAGPALAWDSVTISIAPAGGAGTTIAGTGGDVIDSLLTSAPMGARPTSDLGPRYVITYTFPARAGESGVVVQDLYPYAPGGPVAYSAGNASIVGHPTMAGWHQGDASVLPRFVAWGLPAVPDGAVSAPAPGASDGAVQDQAAAVERTRILLVGLAAALVGVLAIAGFRRRLAAQSLA